MEATTHFSTEVLQRAIRLEREPKGEQAVHKWMVIFSILGKMGSTAETSRRWVRKAEKDRSGTQVGDDRRASADH